ncbi:MAG: sugar ABC transporter permease [Treponema sp.]|jgi:multiple sugar transport system permease protein|nr:sugar ABC transporter permease [Treponema sp.]
MTSALLKRSVNLWGWLFVIPTLAGLLILNIIPVFQTVWQGFFKVGDFGRGNIFVGLENYARLLADRQVWRALLNTLIYTLVEVPCALIIAFVFAVMLNEKIAGRDIFRIIFFLPMVAAPAAAAMVWRWLYNSSFGLLNHILRTLGMRTVAWVSDPGRAVFSIAAIGIWATIGYNVVLFLAGLQEIPRDFYDAGSIDGAGPVRKHLVITLPLVSPTIYFITVTRTFAAMQVFDFIFMVMDKNSPALYGTQSLVYLFYRYSFVENNKGYGAVIVLLLLLVILALTVIQQQIQKRWVFYH